MGEEPRELKIKVDTGNIEAVLKRMTELDYENKRLIEEKNQREKDDLLKKQEELEKIRNDPNSGRGVLPANLNPEEGSNPETSREYNSFPELVDDIRKNNPEQFKKLFEKGLLALKEHPQNFEIRDDWKDGTSAIHKQLMKDNELKRGK